MRRAVAAATACVYLPALDLQIAHRDARLASDTPGVVCSGVFVAWPNRAAKKVGIRSGMRVAQARALAPGLQTATVSDNARQQAMQEAWQYLLQFSPDIEIDAQHAGLLWLDPNGLQHLFGTHAQWADAIHRHLGAQRYHANVVVGFNRYAAFALAHVYQPIFVCRDAAHESTEAHAMPLERAPLPADVRETLILLGCTRLGEFLSMPVDEVRQCLGAAAQDIHRLARNQVHKPLAPQKWVPPRQAEHLLETPDDNAHRLLFLIKGMLQPMVDALKNDCQACAGVHVQLRLNDRGKNTLSEYIAPARPTLDMRNLTDLIRLRLTTLTLPAPVDCVTLRVEGRVMRPEQLLMLQQKPKRDVHAATGALAEIRALMGEGAVTRAELCDSWLPESGFRWELLSKVVLPQVEAAEAPFFMVRSVRRRCMPLPPPPKRDIRQWLRRDGHIENMHGPYRVDGHWWHRATERDYYYVETDLQKLIWVYYSRLERRWYRQGHID